MAWPKRGTRKITVEDTEYLWHYDAHCVWCSEDVFTVGQSGKQFVLYIDSYVFGEEIRPKYIADSIRWAVSQGWSPESGPTKALSKNEETEGYFWLEEGQRHAICKPSPPDNV